MCQDEVQPGMMLLVIASQCAELNIDYGSWRLLKRLGVVRNGCFEARTFLSLWFHKGYSNITYVMWCDHNLRAGLISDLVLRRDTGLCCVCCVYLATAMQHPRRSTEARHHQ
jgi:hypothetical protein